jgi:hypothetical protein
MLRNFPHFINAVSFGSEIPYLPESQESVRCLSRLGNEEADIVPAHKQ